MIEKLFSMAGERALMKAHGPLVDTKVQHVAYSTKTGKMVGPHLQTHKKRVAFSSGVNRKHIARGLVDAGVAPGVAVDDLSEETIQELLALKGTNVPIFVDSGAYGEFQAKMAGKDKRISDGEWERRLAVYERLAKHLGSQLHVVAPDTIGNQMGTLGRLQRNAAMVRKIHALGANVIMPMQTGSIPTPDFYAVCTKILGFKPSAGFPLKQAATPHEAVIAAVDAIRPKSVHLLGLGPYNKKSASLIAALQKIDPTMTITQDANVSRSLIGKDNGPHGGPRIITEHALAIKEYDAWHDEDYLDGETSRYTDEAGDPTSWLPEADKARIAEEHADWFARMGEDPKAFLADPTAWMQDDEIERTDDWHDDRWNPVLADLDRVWHRITSERLEFQRGAESVRRGMLTTDMAVYPQAGKLAAKNRANGPVASDEADPLPLFA